MEEMHHQFDMLRYRLETLAKDYFGPQFCDEMRDYIVSHPFIAIALVIIAVLSAIPVGIFLCFALVSVIIALIAFVFIEGSIIIIGGLILVGIVSFISIITVGLTSAVAVAYWSAQKMHRAVCHNHHSPCTRTNNLSQVSPPSGTGRSGQVVRHAHVDGNIAADSSDEIAHVVRDAAENYEFIG